MNVRQEFTKLANEFTSGINAPTLNTLALLILAEVVQNASNDLSASLEKLAKVVQYK